MRLKITAVAVSTALMLSGPAVAQEADGTNVTLKGSVRIGLEYSDPGGVDEFTGEDVDATLTLVNWASRLNFQADTDIGSGMKAFGRYEFGVDVGRSENADGALSTRHAYVGLKGDFGQVLAGQTYHTFYNNVIAPVDQPWWGSCNGCLGAVGRLEDGITYSGSSGTVSGGATLYLANGGEDILDGFELGATFDAGVVKVGVGVQDFSSPDIDPDPTIGVTLSGTAGAVTLAGAVTSQGGGDEGGEDATGVDIYAAYGKTYIDVGMIDQGNSPFGVTLGYTQPIGTNTLAWFELQATDPDTDADTAVTLRAALKYDWE